MTGATPSPTPIRGPLFERVVGLRVEGEKRKKTLALIAAFADAGQASPSLEDLAARLKLKPPQVAGLIGRLQADGYLVVHGKWKRPRRYELTLPEEGSK